MIVMVLLIKFIYMLRIQIMPNITILLKDAEAGVVNNWKIQKFSLNIQIICKMSIKTLKSTIQKDNVKS